MKAKNSSGILMIAVSLLVWLTLGVGGVAQVPEVKPGDSVIFGRFASGGNDDTGTQKRTIPIVGGEVEVSKADSRFNAQTRTVEANAEVYAALQISKPNHRAVCRSPAANQGESQCKDIV